MRIEARVDYAEAFAAVERAQLEAAVAGRSAVGQMVTFAAAEVDDELAAEEIGTPDCPWCDGDGEDNETVEDRYLFADAVVALVLGDQHLGRALLARCLSADAMAQIDLALTPLRRAA